MLVKELLTNKLYVSKKIDLSRLNDKEQKAAFFEVPCICYIDV